MRNLSVLMLSFILVQPWQRELQERASLFLGQAELTLNEESRPAKLAHGAIIIAGLVKDVDPERAERFLRLAAKALSHVDFEDPFERMREQGVRVSFRTPYDSLDLWKQLLSQAARLRTSLVREFIAQLKADKRWKSRLLAYIGRALDDEESLSELTKMSLEYGLSSSTVDILFRLKRKNAERADAIFRSALAAAAAHGDLGQLYWLGAYAIPGVNLPNRFPLVNPSPPDAELSRLFIRTLVDALARAVSTAGQIPTHIYRALVNIRPYAEQFAPDTLTRIDGLLSLVVSRLPAAAIAEAEQRDLDRVTVAEEKVDTLMRRAEAAKDDKTHDDLTARAAFVAATHEEYDRALSIASKIKDRITRRELADLINLEAASHFIGEEAFERAERYALAIEHPERMAITIARLIEKFNKQDEQRLSILIMRAQTRLNRLPSNAGKARAFLWLASSVLPVDAVQGQAMLWQAIQLFNKSHADLNGAAEAAIKIDTGDFATGRVVGSYDLAPVVAKAFRELVDQELEIESNPEPQQASLFAVNWKSAEIRAIAQAAVAAALLERGKHQKEH